MALMLMTLPVLVSSCGGGGGGGGTYTPPSYGSIEGTVYAPYGSEPVSRVVEAAQAGYKPLSGANVSVNCGSKTKTGTTNTAGYFKIEHE